MVVCKALNNMPKEVYSSKIQILCYSTQVQFVEILSRVYIFLLNYLVELLSL